MSNLKVALIQSEPAWENAKESLQRLDEQLATLAEDTELVLLPEMFNTGFSMNTPLISETMDGPTVQWLKEKSKKYIIGGSLVVKENGKYYNRIVIFEKGQILGLYDKKHLFSPGDEHKHFTAGTKKLEVNIKGFTFSFFICYDLRFPEWIRNYTNYDVAVFMASWPKKRMPHWDALLKARAIENQCYVLATNRIGTDGNGIEHIGHTAALRPFGDELIMAQDTCNINYITLEKNEISNLRSRLPFLNDIKQKP